MKSSSYDVTSNWQQIQQLMKSTVKVVFIQTDCGNNEIVKQLTILNVKQT